MPLRDHFRPPVSRRHSWEGFHAQWPAMLLQRLFPHLPDGYSAEPRVHLGTYFEIDIGGFESADPVPAGGGVATRPWSPPPPTAVAEIELPEEYEYAVQVYDDTRDRHLVAAVEFVSPGNKDRPDKRRAFVGKCAALLRRDVSVAVVDLVTERHFNLYRDLLDVLDQPAPAGEAAAVYASACRFVPVAGQGLSGRLEQWDHPLAVGDRLPTLPLWLTADLSVPLELEDSYEETCRVLGIA